MALYRRMCPFLFFLKKNIIKKYSIARSLLGVCWAEEEEEVGREGGGESSLLPSYSRIDVKSTTCVMLVFQDFFFFVLRYRVLIFVILYSNCYLSEFIIYLLFILYIYTYIFHFCILLYFCIFVFLSLSCVAHFTRTPLSLSFSIIFCICFRTRLLFQPWPLTLLSPFLLKLFTREKHTRRLAARHDKQALEANRCACVHQEDKKEEIRQLPYFRFSHSSFSFTSSWRNHTPHLAGRTPQHL